MEEQGKEEPEWDTLSGWTYIGHGEWAPPEEQGFSKTEVSLESEPRWVYNWLCKEDKDIKLHQEVLEGGYPNRWGTRRPVNSKWNLEVFETLLQGYEDQEVVEWMRFGWPTG